MAQSPRDDQPKGPVRASQTDRAEIPAAAEVTATHSRSLAIKPFAERLIPPEIEHLATSRVDKSAVLARFGEGATCAEVAREFGLTERQASGFRMLVRRVEAPAASPSPAVVVRYLREQGDVVVGADQDYFVLNGRFRMTFKELVDRANRILGREGKRTERFRPVR